jgi:hypothetical protein
MCVAVEEAAVDMASLSDDDVRDGLTLWAARLAAGEARFIDLVDQLDAREAWAGVGIVSCAHWLSWQCSLGANAARERVRVARALRDLPVTRAAFGEARLSFSQVRALTRVATPDNEASLLDLARHSTAAQLETVVRGLRRAAASEETTRARDAYDSRALTYYYDDDGTFVIRGRLPAEQGAVVAHALDAIVDEFRRTAAIAAADSVAPARISEPTMCGEPTTIGEPRTIGEPTTIGEPPQDAFGVSAVTVPTRTSHSHPVVSGPAVRADALAELAGRVLQLKRGTATAGDSYRVLVHIDEATLRDDGDGDGAHVEDGPTLAPEVVRRLLCESSVRAVTTLADGTLLDLGRTARFANRAQRRAMKARDKRCQFAACSLTRGLHAHHLIPWSRGGSTDIADMVLLCSHHHHLVHEGGFSIRREADGRLVTRAPAGWEIDNEPPPRRAGAPELVSAHGEGAIQADTLTPDWHGDRVDLEYVVWTLLHQRRPSTSVGDPHGNNDGRAGEATAWGADRPMVAAEHETGEGEASADEARQGDVSEDDAAA